MDCIVYKYLVRYTNEIGERKTYKNKGFDTIELAKDEINKILEQKKNMKHLGSYLKRSDDYDLNMVCLNGKNIRIKRVSKIVHDLIFIK